MRWAKRFLQFASLDEAAAYCRSYTYYDRLDFTRLLSPDLLPIVDRLLEEHATIYNRAPVDCHVNRMCFTDLKLFLPGLNLTYSDRASMAASTEMRVPLVDVKVMNAAFRARGNEKIRGQQGKMILKRAAEAWLPKEIIYRPKAAFGAPLRAWMRWDLAGLVNDILLSSDTALSGIVEPSVIAQIVKEDRAGVQDHAQRIWNLLTLELWFRCQPSISKELTPA
ncbi:MAG: hypothetical protein JOY71_07170 [Acetobacteraceae bacterium]|nr:hypothetical protein [Acetobacteraceae bacterium]